MRVEALAIWRDRHSGRSRVDKVNLLVIRVPHDPRALEVAVEQREHELIALLQRRLK